MERPRRRVRLYALSTCPMCKKTKALLKALGVDHEVIEVDMLDGGEQWLMSKELKKYNPEGTYPTVVIEEVITDVSEASIRKALGLS